MKYTRILKASEVKLVEAEENDKENALWEHIHTIPEVVEDWEGESIESIIKDAEDRFGKLDNKTKQEITSLLENKLSKYLVDGKIQLQQNSERLEGDSKITAPLVNALQYNYGDKTVNDVIRHLNNIVKNPGNYEDLTETLNDMETLFGPLEKQTRNYIASYLAKMQPSYFDPEVQYWKSKYKEYGPGPHPQSWYE